jgi:voltage-gated sodium channel
VSETSKEDDAPERPGPHPVVAFCRALVGSAKFDVAIMGVILVNAVVLGVGTYYAPGSDEMRTLDLINDVCLWIFVAELSARLIACFPRPAEAFRDRWTIFDAVIIVASFTPGVRENATLLRLVRVLRIVRIIRFLPDLRIIIGAIGRSVPGVATLGVAALLLVYVYGMLGWVLFADGDPENFGDVGTAMLTMFVLLTLENLPTYIETGQEVSDWTVPFYISYVLIASFLVFNLFIGIVINSMEDARQEETARRNRETGHADLGARLHTLQAELAQIAHEIEAPPSGRDQGRGRPEEPAPRRDQV